MNRRNESRFTAHALPISEWNIVVEITCHGRVCPLRLRLTGFFCRGRLILIEIVARGTGAAARTQHLHIVGDNFGGIAIMSVLVLPFARLKAAFDGYLRAILHRLVLYLHS